MNREKINPTQWNELLAIKPNMVVEYENGYYQNTTGINDGPPEGNINWIYLGEVNRFESIAKIDASNIDTPMSDLWRIALGIDNINLDELMTLVEWTNNGKIRTDKLESIALTKAIPAAETSISDFCANSDDYEFEENDFIAIPSTGTSDTTYALYYFIGGDKTDTGNYLKTGFSNITISMVDGLADALNEKLNGPLLEGDWIMNRTGNQFTWKLHPNDRLRDVVSRGNFTGGPISFTYAGSDPTTGEGGSIGKIGVHPATYSFYFGDFNQSATGLYNVSISYGALQKNTTGEYNIGIGVFAGKEVTTGKSNTLLGSLAGQKTTTGNFNLMVGRGSGNENTTGYKNTYFGTYAGFNNSTSNLNVLIGYKCGNTAAMGDRNLFLGSFSGQGVTGNNNIIFGIGAGNGDGAISNKLIIHNNHTLNGYGSDDTQEGILNSPQQGQLNRALITGDFVDRWVRMNASYLQVGNPGTNANDITILSGVGITAAQLFTPTSNNDYIQRGWIFQNYYNQTQIDSMLSRVYKVMGSAPNFASLPTTGQKVGDVWNLVDTGDNYVWVDNLNNSGNPGWDKLAGLVDLSAYATINYTDLKFISRAGNPNTQPIYGRLNFKGTEQSPIYIDYGLQEAGANQLISYYGYSHSSGGYNISVAPSLINIINNSGNQLAISPDNGIQANVYYPPSTNEDFVQKQYVDSKKPYKSYVCLMQAGGTPTPSPAFVELENSIGAIVWERTNVGEYFGTLNGAFPIHKVVCFATMGSGNGGTGSMPVAITDRLDDNRVYVAIKRAGDGSAIEMTGQWGSLEIRVYP